MEKSDLKQYINNNKGSLIFSSISTLLFISVLALLMWLNLEFGTKKIDLFMIGITLLCSFMGRIIYTPLGISKGKQSEEYIFLKKSLALHRKIVFKNYANRKYEDEIDRHNLINKCEAYREKIEIQISKNSCKRNQEKHRKRITALEKEKEELVFYLYCVKEKKEYNGSFNIDKVKIVYDKTSIANMFSGGETILKRGEAYNANVKKTVILGNGSALLYSTVFSIVLGFVSFNGMTAAGLFEITMFAFKIGTFAMSAYKGYISGKEAVIIKSIPALQNLVHLSKEILGDINLNEDDVKNITPPEPESVKIKKIEYKGD